MSSTIMSKDDIVLHNIIFFHSYIIRMNIKHRKDRNVTERHSYIRRF